MEIIWEIKTVNSYVININHFRRKTKQTKNYNEGIKLIKIIVGTFFFVRQTKKGSGSGNWIYYQIILRFV